MRVFAESSICAVTSRLVFTGNYEKSASFRRAWFAFDLDDTLHEFRKAAGTAASAVFKYIECLFKIPIYGLKAAYSGIISQTTASAFTDGRKSVDCRKERFTAILSQIGIDSNSDLLNKLVLVYEEALESALEAKCGALDLLIYLKSINKKIAITEEPQDAQEWTIQKLHSKIDFLATSNYFRASKVHGLFGKVLHHLDIDMIIFYKNCLIVFCGG